MTNRRASLIPGTLIGLLSLAASPCAAQDRDAATPTQTIDEVDLQRPKKWNLELYTLPLFNVFADPSTFADDTPATGVSVFTYMNGSKTELGVTDSEGRVKALVPDNFWEDATASLVRNCDVAGPPSTIVFVPQQGALEPDDQKCRDEGHAEEGDCSCTNAGLYLGGPNVRLRKGADGWQIVRVSPVVPGRSSKKPLLIGGVVAVLGGGAALLSGGDSTPTGPPPIIVNNPPPIIVADPPTTPTQTCPGVVIFDGAFNRETNNCGFFVPSFPGQFRLDTDTGEAQIIETIIRIYQTQESLAGDCSGDGNGAGGGDLPGGTAYNGEINFTIQQGGNQAMVREALTLPGRSCTDLFIGTLNRTR